MFSTHLTTLIEGGGSMIVATVTGDGEPRAGRAWSGRVIDADGARVRVLVSADDPVFVAAVTVGPMALTVGDVRTLTSVQVKGRVATVESVGDDDVEPLARHVAAFFRAVHDTDGTPLDRLERLLPGELLAVEVVVDDVFDQTPGPTAGSPFVRGT